MTLTRPASELRLPWPPSVNAYYQSISGLHGRMLTKRARLYRTEVAEAIRLKLGPGALTPYRTPVRIDIELRAPDRRARDLDNHLKGLFDALTHAGVWTDDGLVDELTVRRGPLTVNGAALVLIAALDPIADLPQQR
jgi:crossover junction endodeoxyribonuclease RusA